VLIASASIRLKSWNFFGEADFMSRFAGIVLGCGRAPIPTVLQPVLAIIRHKSENR
jgi:hypothetical protein